MAERDEQRRRELFEQLAATGSIDTRNELAESYAPLAEYFAKRYKNRAHDGDDLSQVAQLALLKAIDRFDVTVGVAFATFAGRTIDGELKRYFRDHSWTIRVPRSLQEASLAVRAAAEQLTMENGVAPTVPELAERTGLDGDLVLQALDVRSALQVESIDKPVARDGDTVSVAATLGEEDEALERSEARMAMRSLLKTLPDRERTIVELRFYDRLSQQQIADRMGISQMHVSRLLRGALESLRSELH
jgi:RNA polymerase sigma-B factor